MLEFKERMLAVQ